MINKILKLIMLIIVAIMIFTVYTYAFSIEPSINNISVKPGEEIIFKIKANEKIVATNFKLNYDNEVFELVRSNTEGLNVAEKNGKIACIYADMSGAGTNNFEIVLKAKIANKSVNFALEDAKFRAVNAKTSYTGSQIDGIETIINVKTIEHVNTNTITNEIQNNVNNLVTNSNKDNTIKQDTKLPKTGEENILIRIIILFVLLIIVNKVRLARLKEIK